MTQGDDAMTTQPPNVILSGGPATLELKLEDRIR